MGYMFKKLDKLIVKAFIGPFIATFFITLLVLLMQFFWLYIDDFVGKGLGVNIVLKFIWYQSAVLVTMALPLAILLSSLMTFGNLGESFELVAIKSSGISLLRFMRPLFFIAILLSGVAFLFSNYIIPVAYLKSRTLLSDIVYAKPAFNIKEGVFYDGIDGFAIKIGKKEANDSVIRDVIVYERNNSMQDNFIIAEKGVMKASANKRYMDFNLENGWHYQEKGPGYGDTKSDYIRLGFKEYKKQFDLTAYQFTESPDSLNKNNERVYSMRQLDKAIDSLTKENKLVKTQLKINMYSALLFTRYLDSAVTKKANTDSAWMAAKTIDQLIPDSAKSSVNQRAGVQVSSLKTSMTSMEETMKDKEKVLRKHKIEWHRKLIYSISCVLLFLVGAPLGSIIRKGGLGTPLIAAIIFFMVFYFSTGTGEKMAKEGTLTPFTGMWLAAFVLLPIGIFLTYKAMRDSQLFNKEWYHRMAKSFRKFIGKSKVTQA
ncbi:MAG: LptF/LptG family permease [Chitinophagaceae bacterium]